MVSFKLLANLAFRHILQFCWIFAVQSNLGVSANRSCD